MRRTLLLLVGVVGCDHASTEDLDRRKPRVDAAVVEPQPPPPPPGEPTDANVVSCYSQGAPNRTCTAPAYCCFNNYSALHEGYCTSSEICEWGTILCDGPEDCASGQRCCATASRGEEGTTGYLLSCKSECGGPPLDHELCHPDGASCSRGSCVTAYGNANDLPRVLHVCL